MINRDLFLKTDRLDLHPINQDSRQQMMDILYCNEIKKTYMIPDFESESEAEKMFNRFVQLSNDTQRVVYGVFLDNRLIGFFNQVNVENKTIEMGYVIHPDYKNNGYATEAFKAIISELFRIGFDTVRAGFFEENKASRRVMEKSGLKEIEFAEELEYRGIKHHCVYMEIKKSRV